MRINKTISNKIKWKYHFRICSSKQFCLRCLSELISFSRSSSTFRWDIFFILFFIFWLITFWFIWIFMASYIYNPIHFLTIIFSFKSINFISLFFIIYVCVLDKILLNARAILIFWLNYNPIVEQTIFATTYDKHLLI